MDNSLTCHSQNLISLQDLIKLSSSLSLKSSPPSYFAVPPRTNFRSKPDCSTSASLPSFHAADCAHSNFPLHMNSLLPLSLPETKHSLFPSKLAVPLEDCGEGNGNPLQYSCLENPMDRGAWWATIHGVTKSRTRLSDFCVGVFRGLSITPPHFHHLIFFFFGI